MRRTFREGAIPLVAVLLLIAGSVGAQPALNLPQPSPKATISQTVGVTEISITYHRPAVSLGEAYDRKGDRKLAVENYRRAQNMTRDPDQKRRISDILARING